MRQSAQAAVCAAIARHLDVHPDAIGQSQDVARDLEMDPLDLILIAIGLEERERVDIPTEALRSVSLVADLTATLRAARARSRAAA
jgi:acyl carrier protein